MFYLLLMAVLICVISGVGLLANRVILWGTILILGGLGLLVVMFKKYRSRMRSSCDCMPDLPCLECHTPDCLECGGHS
ncbi:hypothetical protein [Brevibacillus reuszeri]|uniref:hypothetical protein n=1 Tax=Brevibacillus reuszeri TaxID=54915 RepID=UPI003D1BF434